MDMFLDFFAEFLVFGFLASFLIYNIFKEHNLNKRKVKALEEISKKLTDKTDSNKN